MRQFTRFVGSFGALIGVVDLSLGDYQDWFDLARGATVLVCGGLLYAVATAFPD